MATPTFKSNQSLISQMLHEMDEEFAKKTNKQIRYTILTYVKITTACIFSSWYFFGKK